MSNPAGSAISNRFRGFLPVVVDVETAGFNAKTDALLEIAAILLRIDAQGMLHIARTVHCHVEPFPGAHLSPEALAFNKIDPFHPFRDAKPETEALNYIFKAVRQALKESSCTRAILVGHNAFFDLGFINATVERTGIKRNPFHPFSTLDTVTLSAMAYGQTVLARAIKEAGIDWNPSDAHSANYDAVKTAELFCTIMNQWREFELAKGSTSRAKTS